MAVWKEIRCDENLAGTCHDSINKNPMGFDDLKALRIQARVMGWRRDEGRDCCPACFAELRK